jgi:hypothetical protein
LFREGDQSAPAEKLIATASAFSDGQPTALAGLARPTHGPTATLSIGLRDLRLGIKRTVRSHVGHRARRFVCEPSERVGFANLQHCLPMHLVA